MRINTWKLQSYRSCRYCIYQQYLFNQLSRFHYYVNLILLTLKGAIFVSGLRELDLRSNELERIDTEFPVTLIKLNLSHNNLQVMSNTVLPDKLAVLIINDNSDSIVNLKLPPSLIYFSLGDKYVKLVNIKFNSVLIYFEGNYTFKSDLNMYNRNELIFLYLNIKRDKFMGLRDKILLLLQ